MKIISYRRYFLSVVLLLLLLLQVRTGVFAENNKFNVIRGERPPIDVSKLSSDAYESGVLLIRLEAEFAKQLEHQPATQSPDGKIHFGIATLDRLNDLKQVLGFTQHFLNPAMKNTFTEKHKAWGFHLWYRLQFDKSVDIPALVRAYQALAEVAIAEPEYRKMQVAGIETEIFSGTPEAKNHSDWTPNDPQYANQWHYHNTGQQNGTPGADIDLALAWNMEKGNPDVIVAIVDDGIQYDHPDLAGNMWQSAQGYYGYNFVNNNSIIVPGSHGTHVAGTVAAVTNNGIGVAGIAGGSGIGNGVRLMSCQVFTSTSNGGFHNAPVWAADHGAAISQNSWSYENPGVYNQSELDAIDYFNANGGGTVMNGGITIFSAGNSNSSDHYYPAYYSGTLAVAATTNQDAKAYYSNFGSWVNISAPGGETISVGARGVLSTITGSTYTYYQGTSMACPHVSGVAALLLSLAERNEYVVDNTTLKNLLINNVDNHYPQNPGYVGQLGTGRLNAYLALVAIQNMIPGVGSPVSLTATPVSSSQINLSWGKNIDNDNVMLVWSPDGIFGTPVHGTAYVAGSAIAGGGIVLYTGSNTTFSHTGLNAATTYYYKAFSYNTANYYSAPRNASVITLCGVFNTLPFTENFNASTTVPLCWTVIDYLGNGLKWQFGTHPGGLNGTSGNYAFVNSDAYGQGTNQYTELVSPVLDLSDYMFVNLSFKHFFRQFSNASWARLYYSTNGGTLWNLIQEWITTTSNPATFNQLIPQVDGQASVIFKWTYIGTYAYYWDVDDIEVSGTIAGPFADFYAEPTSAVVGDTITFTDASGMGNFTSWEWSFGQGANPASATGQGPHKVVYLNRGSKTVSLTVDGLYNETKENYLTIAGLGNRLKIHDIIAEAGSEVLLEVEILNDDEFVAFQLDIPLPEGFVYKVGSGVLNPERAADHIFLATILPGTNIIRIIAFSFSNAPFEGNSGIVCSCTIQSPQEPGTYPLMIENGIIGNNLSQNILTAAINGQVTLTSVEPETFTVVFEVQNTNLQPIAGATITLGNTTHPSGDYVFTEVNPGNYDYFVSKSGYEPAAGSVEVTENITVLLTLNAILYTIHAVPDNAAYGSVNGSGIYEHGETVTLTATPNAGYQFINWTENGGVVSTEQEFVFVALENIDLTANFEPVSELIIDNLVIAPFQDTCFNALETIYVHDFIVQPQGRAVLIAGQSIVFYPGATVHESGEVWAYITSSGEFCYQIPALMATHETETIHTEKVGIMVEPVKSFFSIFPNPTTGRFTLQLKEVDETSFIHVEIFGMMGERVLQSQLFGQKQYEFDLSNNPKGVYIVRVLAGNQTGIEKVIKQ